MAIQFPLLKGDDAPYRPGIGDGCLLCGAPFSGKGFAYIAAGASVDLETCPHGNDWGAFFGAGFHGRRSDMSDSADVAIVSDLRGGQFDLQFCSTACLWRFFHEIVDQIEQMQSTQSA